MSEKYFYAINGVRQGPTTLDELKSLAAKQELNRSDLVWKNGMASWEKASTVKEIFEGLPPDLDVVEAEPPPLPPSAPSANPQAARSKASAVDNQAVGASDGHFDFFVRALKNYAKFDGRARRKEFWSFFLIYCLFYILVGLLDLLMGTSGLFGLLYAMAMLIPYIAVGIRRMHDTGRSGWWILLPIGNLIYWAEDAKPGQNQYGGNPKEASV